MAKFKTKGFGLKLGASNPPTTAVTQLGDSTVDLGDRDAAINVTTHDTSGGVHELLDPGFKSPIKLSGEVLYDPADTVHEVLVAAHEAGTLLYFLATLPDTGAETFLAQCRVQSVSMPLPVMGKLAINVVLEGMAATTRTP